MPCKRRGLIFLQERKIITSPEVKQQMNGHPGVHHDEDEASGVWESQRRINERMMKVLIG